MSIIQTIERVRSFAALRGWTRSRFAKEANVQKTTLRHFHNEDWNPTRETLEKLESVIPPDFAADKPEEHLPSAEHKAAS